MKLEEIRALIAEDLAATDRLILTKLASDIPLAKEVANHIIQSGGKRIRPIIGLLVAKALAYQGDAQIKLAAIVELLHTATLLHDDVIDESELRRGQQTANSKWGNEASVLVGDLLYARSFQLIAELNNTAITNLIAEASGIIVEGEVLQLSHCHDPGTNEYTYLEIIKRKTGRLFMIAASCIPCLQNSPIEVQQALANYGENLGIAFQMMDDALDYDADPKETGKNLGDDLAEGKPTLPLIYILHSGNSKQVETVRKALKTQYSTHDVTAIKAIIDETGAIEYTRRLAKVYVQRSIDSLTILSPSPARDALIALAEIAGDRNN
ncbi:MAG: octaprenyl diphosphate synthase [Gammaproteobacteria bacterium RIFCSPHIGHO2_12_FULL_35_23]|nr:MAG: octaprenyl diphosphate synthase [Gammaproteobacteria bacterium RIFCSPHIGHO2_12_FULL_35_23]